MKNSRQRRQPTPRRSDRGRGAALAIAFGIVLVVLVIVAVIGFFVVQAVAGPEASGPAMRITTVVTSTVMTAAA